MQWLLLCELVVGCYRVRKSVIELENVCVCCVKNLLCDIEKCMLLLLSAGSILIISGPFYLLLVHLSEVAGSSAGLGMSRFG